MIPEEIKKRLNKFGVALSEFLPCFYGKITFNYFNGKYVNSNVEQSIKSDNLKKGAEK